MALTNGNRPTTRESCGDRLGDGSVGRREIDVIGDQKTARAHHRRPRPWDARRYSPISGGRPSNSRATDLFETLAPRICARLRKSKPGRRIAARFLRPARCATATASSSVEPSSGTNGITSAAPTRGCTPWCAAADRSTRRPCRPRARRLRERPPASPGESHHAAIVIGVRFPSPAPATPGSLSRSTRRSQRLRVRIAALGKIRHAFDHVLDHKECPLRKTTRKGRSTAFCPKLGVGSRTEARSWIGAGRVTVNGKKIQTPDAWIDPERSACHARRHIRCAPPRRSTCCCTNPRAT